MATTTVKTKKKVYTYHRAYNFVDVSTGNKETMMSQLYQIGVYVICNNDSAMQFNVTPDEMVTQEKHLKKALAENKIKDLNFIASIRVQEVDGFWKEVEK